MIYLASWVVGMGIFSLVFRRTMLGVLVGLQLIMLGSSMIFVLGGFLSGQAPDSNVIGIFIVLSGLAQFVAGGVLAIRQYYLRRQIDVKDLRFLKH